ncbi:MAG: hypothetical protein QMD46_12165, partial [Methanomicrobiales archaeon]|nr:hypothetical protein [Methanomicrobiales archaeon]
GDVGNRHPAGAVLEGFEDPGGGLRLVLHDRYSTLYTVINFCKRDCPIQNRRYRAGQREPAVQPLSPGQFLFLVDRTMVQPVATDAVAEMSCIRTEICTLQPASGRTEDDEGGQYKAALHRGVARRGEYVEHSHLIDTRAGALPSLGKGYPGSPQT